jgi:hypothetical protein
VFRMPERLGEVLMRYQFGAEAPLVVVMVECLVAKDGIPAS